MVELEREEFIPYIKLKDLKDGQIAEIISGPQPFHPGTIVQRYKDILLPIGLISGRAWTSLFDCSAKDTWKLRVLEEGEKIIIKNNN